MFTRSSSTEPKRIETRNGNGRSNGTLFSADGPASNEKSVIGNDLKIIGQGLKIIGRGAPCLRAVAAAHPTKPRLVLSLREEVPGHRTIR